MSHHVTFTSASLSFSSASVYHLLIEMVSWGWWEGKVRGQNVPLWLWCKIYNNKNLSGQIYDIKGIFWAQIIFLMHVPFMSNFSLHWTEQLHIFLFAGKTTLLSYLSALHGIRNGKVQSKLDCEWTILEFFTTFC